MQLDYLSLYTEKQLVMLTYHTAIFKKNKNYIFKEELLCLKAYLFDLIKDDSPYKSYLSFILTFSCFHQHNYNLHMNRIIKIYELNPHLKDQFCS